MRKSRWLSMSLALVLLLVGVVIVAAFPYRIRQGDNLFRLALRHNTTIDDIAAANNITDPDVIYAGDVIEIPGASAPASVAPSTSSPAPAAASYSGGGTYMVGPGDTLYSIAQRYGTTVGAIAQANDIRNVNYVPVGKLLLIPGDFGTIHAVQPQTVYTATLGVQTGTACARINFLAGKDRSTGSRMDGTYVISEYNGRGGLASWKAKKGDVDSGWIHDINTTFDAVHVVVSFYPADGSPPYLMKIVNGVGTNGYGWLSQNICNAIEIEYP
jgi:LysM repeat protein